jgi:hypothetical protein
VDAKTLRKLVRRISVGRIPKGEEADARRRLLDDLHSAGVDTHHATGLEQPAIAAMPGHTLLGWADQAKGGIELFVIPDSAIDDRMRIALDAVNGLDFETPYDCSLFQYAAALRVLAATGLPAEGHEAFFENEVTTVAEEMAGDKDLGELPTPEDVEALWGAWETHHAGRDAFRPGSLDTRLTHAIGVSRKDRARE